MSGWFGSTSAAGVELDAQVERATSSSLEDMALNLEISDTIRSKTVPPKEAMRSLKKRIAHKNPNVQLSALNLTDTCVKNGGSHFMQEVASKEFLDTLVSLLRYEGGGSSGMGEREVRQRLLELIQSWAGAAQGKESLSYLTVIYHTLQTARYPFPPKQEVASSMYDSTAPPEWADSDVCMRCRERFTFTNRKHHCRNCGNVFCGPCSAKALPLPHLGITTPVRVDDGCYAKLQAKSSAAGPQSPGAESRRATLWQDSGMGLSSRAESKMHPRSARLEPESFDADLKRALEMSLEESKGGAAGAGYVPQSALQQSKPAAPNTNGNKTTSKPKPEESGEEDEDLKAAIAASLQDMETQKSLHTRDFKARTTATPSAHTSTPQPLHRPNNNDLTPLEAENINLFATLVDRLAHQPHGTLLREPQIQDLYESIGALRPKLARSYGEAMSKHDALLELHAKLGTVVRYYDQVLEMRLANAYGGSRQSTMGAGARGSGLYPGLPPTHMQGPAARGGGGGVESYYTAGEPQMDAYTGYPPPASTPTATQAQTPYPAYEPQGMGQGYAAPPDETAAGYYTGGQPAYPHAHPHSHPPPGPAPAPHGLSSPASEHSAGNYYLAGEAGPGGPGAPQYPPQQQQQQRQRQMSGAQTSPESWHRAPSLHQQQQPPQAHQMPPSSSSAAAAPGYPIQHPQQQQRPQNFYQQPPPQQQQQWSQAPRPTTASGYGLEGFPAAPSHAPAAAAAAGREESLIEF
ncbi:hypothetical protein B0A50_05028 [Salinomyces thailandicus]|uniref:Vacuolar protein sorting-associated protein 27 n=1 Tax=Salinomyces thailandicus TaxID=706561 RepID=A0A4U0TZE6_9PEZI|nr:hypothetical protein B0A50_05028 [Salinomyces thailandica]